MGCNSSKYPKAVESDFNIWDAIDAFAPEEVTIIQQTWPIASDDKTKFSKDLFKMLFNKRRQLVTFFKKMTEHNTTGALDWDIIASHGEQVISVFSLMVDNIKNLESVREDLFKCGKTHGDLDIETQYMILLWIPFRDTLKLRLGSLFNSKVELAWKHLFDYLVYNLGQGIDSTVGNI